MPVTTRSAAPKSAVPSTYSPHWLIPTWFTISTLIVFWDAGFCLLRPRSMSGGDLQWIWGPYALYETVDLVYGPEAFARGDGFTAAQALLNLVENALNITYLFLWRQQNPVAILVGYSAVLFTFWKTVLYWLMDWACTTGGVAGWCQTGHNSTFRWWVLFAFPNFQWILIPFIIACVFGLEIARGLRTGGKAKVL